MEFSEDDWEEEEHFGDVVLSLSEYVMDAELEIARKTHAYSLLSASDAALLAHRIPARLAKQRECARTNQAFLNLVLQPFIPNLNKRALQLQSENAAGKLLSTGGNLSKVRGTLHQIYREWSSQGALERAQCFGRIIAKLREYLPSQAATIAVPGCGLSRLCVDLAEQGYWVEGSEFSYQMLITGDCIMNRLNAGIDAHVIFPWIDQASNLRAASQVLDMGVRFPDMVLSNETRNRVHIVAGEFCRIYEAMEQRHRFDAVVFCFFLDTAPNLCEYLRVVRHILKPGGYLLSFGPLQWHFQPAHGADGANYEDARFAQSLELTMEEVLELIQSFGFEIKFHEQVPQCAYAKNAQSMLHTTYDCEFLVAKLR